MYATVIHLDRLLCINIHIPVWYVLNMVCQHIHPPYFEQHMGSHHRRGRRKEKEKKELLNQHLDLGGIHLPLMTIQRHSFAYMIRKYMQIKQDVYQTRG